MISSDKKRKKETERETEREREKKDSQTFPKTMCVANNKYDKTENMKNMVIKYER